MGMSEDGVSKNQGKRRHDRDSCINNVKLTLNCTKDYSRCRSDRQIDDSTYVKRSKIKLARGSLENVSVSHWGEPPFDGQSSLRRTRSLAVSGENIFSDLDYTQRQRRCQLIPRAKLIDRSSVRGRRYKGLSSENLAVPARSRKSQPSITPPDYSPPEPSFIEKHRAPDSEIYSYVSLDNIEETVKHDSLDSNLHNKTSINSIYRVSYEDIPGLSLPNYYPDSKYDTDNTDNVSVQDNISSISLDNLCKITYSSFNNLQWNSGEQESISYDENIVLAANKKLYEVNETTKPRTIRGPTPYHKNNYAEVNVAEDQVDSYTETDKNLDEINLNNENITKLVEEEEEEESIEPEYEESLVHTDIKEPPKEIDSQLEVEETPPADRSKSDYQLKTLIEVSGKEEKTKEVTHDSEQYKTVITVDTERRENFSCVEEESKCKHSRKESKHHSHNYLREFLETQKGSTKPLQNFIAKKFSNLSRRNSKEDSNLTENQFCSLPDITASKNLRKCEKIDRKLRKCEKNTLKPRETSKENRFIVNIGRHFDITANSSIPVDFEVKIAKIPKKNRKHTIGKTKSDDQLIAAVRNLKETIHGNLDENQNITKPEIVSVKTKNKDDMDLLYCKEEYNKEFREKLGTMRDYWDKMVGNKSPSEEKETGCKIVDLHTKVEEVKKLFEQTQEKIEEKPPSMVQMTKQIFEPKPVVEKSEKISPMIKESCSYFENNNNCYDNERQYESLCPTAVEIIDKKDVTKTNGVSEEKKTTNKSKSHRAATKSTSNSPEFDHVRYKIVKSDLFQKKIFAKCEMESQFDGLMQYLQDYSFQELLIDNNIVIIEPIRSKVHYEPTQKTMKNVTHLLHKPGSENNDTKPGLNRHFFYHPIRVNKEVNDDELPNPDTVRQVRQFFEGGVKRSQSTQDLDQDKYASNGVDPDKDRCSATDSNSHPSNMSDFDGQDNLYDSIDNEIYCEYVSEDILEKIREYGTTVTYYGGRVVDRKSGQPVLTRAIMEEIRNNEKRCTDCNNCRKNSVNNEEKEIYSGVKFKIVKSNSCSSRLELVGADNLQETKKKFIAQHKKLSKQKKESKDNEKSKNNKFCEKNAINECIKKQAREEAKNQPKIIAEERKISENKFVQWGELKNEKTFTNINFSEKSSQRIYDFHNYDKVKDRTKKMDEMEFEPYEIA